MVLIDIKVGSSSVLRSPVSAMLDTGSSVIVGPIDDVAYLANEIGAMCVAISGPDSSQVVAVSVRLSCVLQGGGIFPSLYAVGSWHGPAPPPHSGRGARDGKGNIVGGWQWKRLYERGRLSVSRPIFAAGKVKGVVADGRLNW